MPFYIFVLVVFIFCFNSSLRLSIFCCFSLFYYFRFLNMSSFYRFFILFQFYIVKLN